VKIKWYVDVTFNEYGTSWQSSPTYWAKDWTGVTGNSWQRRGGRSIYESKPTFSEGLERDRHFLSSISDVPQSTTRNVFKQEYYTGSLFKKKVKQTTLTSFLRPNDHWPKYVNCIMRYISYEVHFTKLKIFYLFNVHGSMHHINILLHIIPTRYIIHRVYFYLTLLSMFQALLSRIVRSTPPITHSNQFRLFHNSNRQQYGYEHYSLFYRTYCIFHRIYIIQQL
jgi:hypothetical protein